MLIKIGKHLINPDKICLIEAIGKAVSSYKIYLDTSEIMSIQVGLREVKYIMDWYNISYEDENESKKFLSKDE